VGRLGKSTISSTDSIHIPKAVMEYFNLAKGDLIAWYPPDEDFNATAELLAVKVLKIGDRPPERRRAPP